MKNRTAVVCMACAALCGFLNAARANESATAYVGTVLGTNAFTVQNGGSQLYFHPQPDTDYVWKTKDGDTLTYTSGGVTANRDGMKTFACTDIAYGKRLDTVKLEFDYYAGADPTTGLTMSSPSINVCLTDGSGNYAIWSATSGGTAYTTAAIDGETSWYHLTLDCTNLAEKTWGQMNEYTGGLATNKPMWSITRAWTIAGFYDILLP